MNPPYASIIIPTHDRVATLPLAVASFQRQTIADIEIIIAGDGATREVAGAANALAARDPRVRFLDQAKAPGRGAENRHRAVMGARAERIFYSDDDDLVLPSHVEILGAALDTADVADSLIVMVARSGSPHVMAVNNSSTWSRARTVAGGAVKTLFDTHVAHRRSAYLALGAPWCGARTPSLVRDLFACFAESAIIRWRSLPVPTALTFNGHNRRSMTAEARRAELEEWLRRSEALQPAALLPASRTGWFTCHLARAMQKAGETLDIPFAERVGVAPPAQASEEKLGLDLAPGQWRDLATAFDLVSRQPVAIDAVESVLPQLLDRVAGEKLPLDFLQADIAACLGHDPAEFLLGRCAVHAGPSGDELKLLYAQMLAARGRLPEAEAQIAAMPETSPLNRAEAELILCAARRRLDPKRAIGHASKALEWAPEIMHGHALLFDILVRSGRTAEARAALERLRALRPDYAPLERMQARLRDGAAKPPRASERA